MKKNPPVFLVPLLVAGHFLLIAFFSGCAGLVEFAHNKNADPLSAKKISVLPLVMSDKVEGAVLAGCWETELMGLGYEVIERGNIETILGEQGLSLSGATSAEQSAKIGRLLGSEGIIFGSGQSMEHSIKLVNAQTAQTLWSVSARTETQAQMELPSKMAVTIGKKLKKLGWKIDPDAVALPLQVGRIKVYINPHIQKVKIQKVAVLPFRGENGEIWADKVANTLLKTGYDVIERSQIEQIFKEEKLSLTGAITQEDADKLLKVHGIQGMIFGNGFGLALASKGTSAGGYASGYKFSIKLVNMENGELLWSAYGNIVSSGEDFTLFPKLFRKIDETASGIRKRFGLF